MNQSSKKLSMLQRARELILELLKDEGAEALEIYREAEKRKIPQGYLQLIRRELKLKSIRFYPKSEKDARFSYKRPYYVKWVFPGVENEINEN